MNSNEENQNNNPQNTTPLNNNLIDNLPASNPDFIVQNNFEQNAKNKKTNLLVPIFGIVIILLLGFILIKLPSNKKADNGSQNILNQIVNEKDIEGAKNASNLPDQKISQDDHVNGKIDARLVLVEYSDLDCPYCARFHPTVKKLISEYPNDVAWVYRHFPLDNLHKNARTESVYSECVAQINGNDSFWQFIDNALAYNSSSVDEPQNVLKNLVTVDQDALTKCFTNQKTVAKIKQKIENDEKLAKASGAQGTPFSVLVDRQTGAMYPVPGAQDIETMREIVKTILNDK